MDNGSAGVELWQGAGAPSEREIEAIMQEQGLEPYRWSNAAGDMYAVHTHPYHKVLYVVRGSITFRFPSSGHEVTLAAGDRLNLPPRIAHEAVVGPDGVVCLEAHQP
jgi:quercetin dioxygenase-like cupin family protein